jgi:hypothetical protein
MKIRVRTSYEFYKNLDPVLVAKIIADYLKTGETMKFYSEKYGLSMRKIQAITDKATIKNI